MNDQDFLDANEALDLARQQPPFRLNFTSSASEFGVSPVGGGADSEVSAVADPIYEQFLADVWVGIVLTLMVLSCVCFMCTCLVYHKIQEWKTRALQNHHSTATVENGFSESELPSYTVASGLPTYDEALEQLKKCNQTPQNSLESHQNSVEVSKLPSIKEENSTSRLGGFEIKTNANDRSCHSPTPTSTQEGSSRSVFNFFKSSKKLAKSTAT